MAEALRPHRALGLALVFLLPSACGGEASTEGGVVAPATFDGPLIAGAAPLGEGVDPRFVQVLRPGELFVPAGVAGATIDAFIGGLAPSDLPEGLDPGALPLAAAVEPGARPLPPLRGAHVIARPGTVDALAGFVPVSGPTLDAAEATARAERLRVLVESVYIRAPCIGDPNDVSLFTPRTPAERFESAWADPSGEVRLGLVASGTAAVAVFRPGASTPRIEGISVPTELDLSNRRIRVRGLGPLTAATGRARHVIISAEGAFDRAGILLRDGPRAYVDDTPLTSDAPVRSIVGVRDGVDDNGVASTCAFGGVRGPLRDAGLWCRAETSTVWRTEFRVPGGQNIVALHTLPDGRWVAADRAGRLHLRDGRWRTVAEVDVNRGCRPACSPFDLATFPARPGEDGRLELFAGEDAQLFVYDPMRREPGLEPVRDLELRTFVDERFGSEDALSFSSTTRSPDGRWWIGTAEGVLFRGSSDLSRLDRVCLPAAAWGSLIGAMAAADDGRLVFGIGTGQVGFARWDALP